MIYVLSAVLAIIIINLYLFISRRFSPIPYFPTNNRDLDLIIKTLNLKKNDVLYDLGAGDGTVIMAAAQKPTVHVVGVEIHPLLVLIMHIKRLLHPNRHNITIIWGDIFKTDLSKATKIYLYVGPFVMKRLVAHIFKSKSAQLKQITSYMYDFTPPLKPTRWRKKKNTGWKPIYTVITA